MKETEPTLWESLKWPGLTPGAPKLRELTAQLPVQLAAFSYKRSRHFLWVVFIGGTGTGKSTLFNALIGKPLSETGVERPKTCGPLIYAHQAAAVDRDFPFAVKGIQQVTSDRAPAAGYAGTPGQVVVIPHEAQELSHLVIVDTPDLDSVELQNRQMVEDLLLLADVVIFVASQEKYADEVPFRFLSRLHLGQKPYYLLLNKAHEGLTGEEVLDGLRGQGLEVGPDRFWMLPYFSSGPGAALAEFAPFAQFKTTLLRRLSKDRAPGVMQQERVRAAREAGSAMELLLALLQEEAKAASQWLEQLESFSEAAGQNLLTRQEERFATESRTHIQREIRKHFSKYDLLATPRRFIGEIIRTPLRLLGLWPEEKPPGSEEDLAAIFRTADLTMIQAAVEGFNRSVLEQLSPQDQSSALYGRLREPNLVLSEEAIRYQMTEEQVRLMQWLEETFQRLAQGIPRSKELGIYSTSILWGALIIALETAIGGGISLLEAVFNTAIAPFVTKGAVDLFAYHELQKIVRELGERYRKALTAPLGVQSQRYREALQALLMSPQVLPELKAVMTSLEAWEG